MCHTQDCHCGITEHLSHLPCLLDALLRIVTLLPTPLFNTAAHIIFHALLHYCSALISSYCAVFLPYSLCCNCLIPSFVYEQYDVLTCTAECFPINTWLPMSSSCTATLKHLLFLFLLIFLINIFSVFQVLSDISYILFRSADFFFFFNKFANFIASGLPFKYDTFFFFFHCLNRDSRIYNKSRYRHCYLYFLTFYLYYSYCEPISL